jgi:hypothetical protein
MERLGLQDDPRVRWSVAGHVDRLWRGTMTSPEKRRQIAAVLGRPYDEAMDRPWREQFGSWHLASILLSEDEKLVARYILMHGRRGMALPSLAQTAGAMQSSVQEVSRAIRMLARIGYLTLPDGRRPSEYALAKEHGSVLGGLGFSFHTVTLDTGERFGVPCAVDFLLLVGSQYRQRLISVDDACAHCVDRIRIEADHGRLVRVEPLETVVYQGGT